jgi:hypothetical protein
MRRVSVVPFWLLCLSIGANAQPLSLRDGVYDAFDCTVPFSDQRVELDGQSIIFYETSCERLATQPMPGIENAVVVDAACEGEGETWTSRMIFMPTGDGGIVMMNISWGDHYQRCN